MPRDSRSGYLAPDTIAALSTAPGGAIAIVRVSGPRAFAVLDGLTREGFAASLAPRRLALAQLRAPTLAPASTLESASTPADAPGAALDSALVARFVAPDSFTGEDLIELHGHGGAYVATRVLEAALEAGARQALPGEFSFRAVRSGKLALSQAQAVADLIAARNDGALALALEKLSGSQARATAEIAEQLRHAAVLAEAGIDFSDQDLDEVHLGTQKRALAPVIASLEKLAASYDRGARMQAGVRTAFVGRPNVGKSSLFNALLGEDRSIVSATPGTTRDVVREQLTLRGPKSSITLRLEDTAGLRTSDDPIEQEGIARTRRAAREADLVLWLVDASDAGSDAATGAIAPDSAEWQGERTIGVVTKKDLVPFGRIEALVQRLRANHGIQRWVTTSALTGEGIEALAHEITSFCELWSFRESGEVLLTRLDHLEAVRDSLAHLKRAFQASPPFQDELYAADLRQALAALAPLIGDTLPDDILGRIFSDFCIGK